MAPVKRKGEQPVRDAAAAEQEGAREKAPQGWPDEREEEGYSQPESSAQKTPSKPKAS